MTSCCDLPPSSGTSPCLPDVLAPPVHPAEPCPASRTTPSYSQGWPSLGRGRSGGRPPPSRTTRRQRPTLRCSTHRGRTRPCGLHQLRGSRSRAAPQSEAIPGADSRRHGQLGLAILRLPRVQSSLEDPGTIPGSATSPGFRLARVTSLTALRAQGVACPRQPSHASTRTQSDRRATVPACRRGTQRDRDTRDALLAGPALLNAQGEPSGFGSHDDAR